MTKILILLLITTFSLAQ
jgi:Calcineurin-like phosphoesterase